MAYSLANTCRCPDCRYSAGSNASGGARPGSRAHAGSHPGSRADRVGRPSSHGGAAAGTRAAPDSNPAAPTEGGTDACAPRSSNCRRDARTRSRAAARSPRRPNRRRWTGRRRKSSSACSRPANSRRRAGAQGSTNTFSTGVNRPDAGCDAKGARRLDAGPPQEVRPELPIGPTLTRPRDVRRGGNRPCHANGGRRTRGGCGARPLRAGGRQTAWPPDVEERPERRDRAQDVVDGARGRHGGAGRGGHAST